MVVCCLESCGISCTMSEAPVNRTNLRPVERSAREVPLIRTVSYEEVGVRPSHAKMNLLSSPTLPNR